MINKLKEMNEKLIDENKNNPEELKKFMLIREILNQKECFINMNIEYAYSILRELKIPEEEIQKTYLELI